tara:strand:+ start:186 stop:488 length:303 start_codon:yes stop_codon:yes gene_type:complete
MTTDNKGRDLQDKEKALEFARSSRGHYIISQALYIAINALNEVKPPHREVSNISDMEYILHTTYPEYSLLHHESDKIRKASGLMTSIEKALIGAKEEGVS